MRIYLHYLGWHELQIAAVKIWPHNGKWIFSELRWSESIILDIIDQILEYFGVFLCSGAFSQCGINTFTSVGNTSWTVGEMNT